MAVLSQAPCRPPRRRRAWHGLALAIPLLFARVSADPASADAAYRIKAVFLLNFAHFVRWPPAALADETSPFIIGVLGDDPFGNSLDGIVAGEGLRRGSDLFP